LGHLQPVPQNFPEWRVTSSSQKSIRQSLKNARDFETDGADKKDCDQDGDDHENDLMPRMWLKSKRRPTSFALFFHRKSESHGLSA